MAKKPKSRCIRIEDAQALNIPYTFCSSVYLANEPLTCIGCQKTILTDELFFRSRDKLGYKPGIKYIQCANCINLPRE